MSEFNTAVDQVISRLKGGWIKNSYAHDEKGETVNSISPKACKFCLSGAIIALRNPVMEQKIRAAIYPLILDRNDSLPSYNDRQETVDPIIVLLESIKVKTSSKE